MNEAMAPNPIHNSWVEIFQHSYLDYIKSYATGLNRDGIVPVIVDPDLASHLREEQKEGLQFLFDNFVKKKGCILAHLMGAGKTLTCVSLIHVLMEQSIQSRRKSTPSIQNAVLVVPKTMVGIWELEFKNWLKDRAFCKFQPEISVIKFRSITEDGDTVKAFLSSPSPNTVLILSYEKFTKFEPLFTTETGNESALDLIIFDEAHLLKSSATKRSIAAATSKFQVKILVTATPVQNTLEELFRLVEIAQPGALHSGTNCNEEEFKKKYINPFLPGTLTRNHYRLSPEDNQKLVLLKNIINPILHIRQNPVKVPKHEVIVCLKLQPLQRKLYQEVSNRCMNETNNMKNYWYSHIILLRTICGHPKLAMKQIRKSNTQYIKSYHSPLLAICKTEDLYKTHPSPPSPYEGLLSHKMKFIYTLVHELKVKYELERTHDKSKRITDKERVVIVSNYTEVLDMVEKLISTMKISCLKLYGKTPLQKRVSNIGQFNDLKEDYPVFLLSLKAGGAGITLTGANHLVLLDPDWNPANDEQAIARIWRHGQTRPCYVYRLFSTGTIEEVIFKRQLTKKELDKYIMEDDFSKFNTLPESAKELVTLKQTKSSIHDSMNCTNEGCSALTQPGTSSSISSTTQITQPRTSVASTSQITQKNPSSSLISYNVQSSSFGDYALEGHPVSQVEGETLEIDSDSNAIEEEIQCDISSLVNWDHFHNDQQLRAEEGMPILGKIWGLDRNPKTSIGISFVFYKKTNPIEEIKDARELLDIIVRSPASMNN